MNKIQYFYYKEHFNKEGIEYDSYSIIATSNNTIIRYIADVFLYEESAANFVSLCNELNLSIIHVDDVIEDFISI